MNETDPPRLRDGEGELAELLRRGYDDLPDADEMRRFEPRLDPTPEAPRPPPGHLWLKAGGALGLAAALVGVGASLRPAPSTPASPRPSLTLPAPAAPSSPLPPEPSAPATSAPAALAAPSPEAPAPSAPGPALVDPARRPPARSPSHAPSTSQASGSPAQPAADPAPPSAPTSAASAATAPDLSLELSLLDRARRKVSSSPSEALSLASEHARLFPKSPFGLEREVIVIEALARSGRRPEAQQRAKRLLEASPRSAYRQKLEALFP